MVLREKVITIRDVPLQSYSYLIRHNIDPILARLWSSRGVKDIKEINTKWSELISPFSMLNLIESAKILADSIENKKKILIVSDYDCDGATACAVGIRALSAMGANVDFFVPNRFKTGYGLTTEVVNLVSKNEKPDIILTVDNGISSIGGVKLANDKNISVIITDHHLPGKQLPKALSIVNPNQINCKFKSKNLAGVGVIFYVMLALRAELRNRGILTFKKGQRLENLLDLVALGTVADLVKLDSNNRLLVSKGLQQIRNGFAQEGMKALISLSGLDYKTITTDHLGFNIGPKLNAAGRLDDMRLGIECLLTDDKNIAFNKANILNAMNLQRRQIEKQMNKEADYIVNNYIDNLDNASICIYKKEWHQGVIGLIASKLKEKFYRPVIIFTESGENEIRGSGRSVAELNLRNALEKISSESNIIKTFGGHAMAVGLTILKDNFELFKRIFNRTVIEMTGLNNFTNIIETDGSLDDKYINIKYINIINQQVWGNGFPAPLFMDSFKVIDQKIISKNNLKMIISKNNINYNAIFFGQSKLVPNEISAVYRLTINNWNKIYSVQLIIEHIN